MPAAVKDIQRAVNLFVVTAFSLRFRGLAGLLTILFLIIGNAYAADDDDYLRSLDEEVEKIEPSAQQGAQPADAADNASSENREQFEELLRERYHGSYVFYQKLPNRMQQEVYDDYASGEDFAQLRKKIINRYLQQ